MVPDKGRDPGPEEYGYPPSPRPNMRRRLCKDGKAPGGQSTRPETTGRTGVDRQPPFSLPSNTIKTNGCAQAASPPPDHVPVPPLGESMH
ncbi:hypothetical protein WJX75_006348 [Coccomyxa subellipsoidea]|uniref:Uncharacterized protein n=1 Tax=Coccomyxa subellipsoidea TaxID=248742 RepID=A0ABR2YPQ2_9CHLO